MIKTKGMFWHVHHGELCEYCYNYQGRVDYIKRKKPKNEIKTRLKLFKPVKGKLPAEFDEAWKKYVEAWRKCDEALEKYNEAREKRVEAREKYLETRKKYLETRKKYLEAWKKYKPEIEALHKKECGCSEWNGKEIVFKEKKTR